MSPGKDIPRPFISSSIDNPLLTSGASQPTSMASNHSSLEPGGRLPSPSSLDTNPNSLTVLESTRVNEDYKSTGIKNSFQQLEERMSSGLTRLRDRLSAAAAITTASTLSASNSGPEPPPAFRLNPVMMGSGSHQQPVMAGFVPPRPAMIPVAPHHFYSQQPFTYTQQQQLPLQPHPHQPRHHLPFYPSMPPAAGSGGMVVGGGFFRQQQTSPAPEAPARKKHQQPQHNPHHQHQPQESRQPQEQRPPPQSLWQQVLSKQSFSLGSSSRSSSPTARKRSMRKPIALTLGAVAAVATILAVSLVLVKGQKSSFSADLWPEEMIETNHQSGIRGKRNPQFPFTKTPFNLQEILDNNYNPETWNGTWVSDTQYVYRDVDDSLIMVDAETGTTKQAVPGHVLRDPRVFRFKFSPDLQYVMLASRPQRLFRHSFLALYDIYHIASGRRIKLQPDLDGLIRSLAGPNAPPSPPLPANSPQLPMELAMWGPVGSNLVYVFGANIFYRETPEAVDVMVTTSGRPGVVFNGVADWVYEEEVLSDTKAVWFSPDGDRIAWIEFNDTNVDVMTITHYGQPGSLQFQYPIQTPLRYPKPGRANPTVRVFSASVRGISFTPRASQLNPPAFFDSREQIIYNVAWATNDEVSLTWETRHQNYSVVSICNVEILPARCQDSLVMTSPGGWLELEDPPIFTKDGRQFAMALSANGYKQVNVINRDTNQRVPITSGKMVVTKVQHWDDKTHEIYFMATREGSPGERHLYKVTDFQSVEPGLVSCLTCQELNTRGGNCGYNTFEFSATNSFYVMSCNGPHVPQVYLYKTNPNQRLDILVDNAKLSSELALKALPKVSNLDVPVKNGKYMAKVRLYLPPDFNENKKYPLLINVYAGPNSQQVNDRFKLDWGTYLATNQKIIYGLIDARGSGFKGDDMLHEIYHGIGQVEVEDQIEVTTQLVNLYSFIDRKNVAIWGWSYGGFVTASVLAKDSQKDNIFKCGISVAPVTNWIYYDSIYTERYLGLPTEADNAAGYKASDVTAKAKKLLGKKFMIVHGTADDNVHYQQSMMLARAMEEADVLFRQLSYPDEAHGLVGLRPHFYHSLSDFLLNDCFSRPDSGVPSQRPVRGPGTK